MLKVNLHGEYNNDKNCSLWWKIEGRGDKDEDLVDHMHLGACATTGCRERSAKVINHRPSSFTRNS